MNAILKPLAVPNLFKHATPVKKPRRKKGEKAASASTKPVWPFKELTVNQKRTHDDVLNRTNYADRSKYSIAKTLVIKCMGDDKVTPFTFERVCKRIRYYQDSYPEAHPVRVMIWLSDVQRTVLLEGEFRMRDYDACSVLRDSAYSREEHIYGVECTFFSEKDHLTLASELEAMPPEERWMPDEKEMARRHGREKAEKEAARDRDFYPRFAREMNDLSEGLWPVKFIANPAEKHTSVRSFDADIRKILKRFDVHALATFDSLVDDFGVDMVDPHWSLYKRFFEGMSGCGYDSDRRLRGWGWCKRSVDSFIELFELVHKKHRGTTQTT